jgi:hypothetical protein
MGECHQTPVIPGSPHAPSHQDNNLHEKSHTKLSSHPVKNLEDSPSGWDSSTNSLPTGLRKVISQEAMTHSFPLLKNA